MKAQPLPKCHQHPRRRCPGECQYLLGPDQCLNVMQRVRRDCLSCGSLRSETPFPPDGSQCTDCLEDARKASAAWPNGRRTKITTRASYRAALRIRQASSQLDWVDGVVPAP